MLGFCSFDWEGFQKYQTPTIALVTTIIEMIANLRVGNAFVVGTFELQRRARSRPFSAKSDVVFVRTVATVVHLITDLPQRNTLLVLTLELARSITFEIGALVFWMVKRRIEVSIWTLLWTFLEEKIKTAVRLTILIRSITFEQNEESIV